MGLYKILVDGDLSHSNNNANNNNIVVRMSTGRERRYDSIIYIDYGSGYMFFFFF